MASPRPLPGNARILQLVGQGMSYSKVAAEVGRSRSAVCGVVMRDKARRARAAEEEEAAAARHAFGRAQPRPPRRFSWEAQP